MKSLSLRAHQKGLELALDLDASVPKVVVGDPGRLRQIIVNLAGNAIKFTETGEVVLAVKCESSEGGNVLLHFSVRDTGIGIAPENITRIFRAFEQADNSSTRQFGGTGLGITISSRLAELMHGRIWVESKVGYGSNFHFTARFEKSTTAVGKDLVLDLNVLKGKRALVVDDNATNRRILHDTLRQWHMQPVLVGSAPAALEFIRESMRAGHAPELMVVDSEMPGMDGCQLLEELHARGQLQPERVIMLTSADRPENVLCCRQLNIAAYLTKPATQADLLRSVLDTFRSQQVEHEVIPEVRERSIPRSGRRLRILLAEDNALNQQVARGMFEEMGYSVTSAMNGRQAVERFQEETFDLIFMDIQMPILNGYEATAIIQEKQKHAPRRVPIIAMTAHAMSGDREKCLAAGMDDYISKPIRADALFAIAEKNVPLPPGGNVADAAAPAKLPASPPTPEFKIKTDPGNPLLINVQLILGRFGGNQNLFKKAASMFPGEAASLLEAIEQAQQTENLEELQRAAHTLKGICKMFEAAEAASAALELEAMARSGRRGTEQQVEKLRAELERAMAALNQLETQAF